MPRSKSTTTDYNGLNQELISLLAALEQGELDVDTAVEHYRRGLEIVAILEAQLQKVENKITELKAAHDEQSLDDGQDEEE